MFGNGELDVPSEEGMIAATGGASSISNLRTHRRGAARSSLKMLGIGEQDVPSEEGKIAARRGGASSSLMLATRGGASSSLMLATRGELHVPSKEGMITTNQTAKKAMEPDLGQSLPQPPLQEEDRQEPVMEECIIPQSPPHVQGPPNPGVGGGPQRDQLPEDLHPPQDGVGRPIPPEVGDCNQEGQLLLAPIPI